MAYEAAKRAKVEAAEAAYDDTLLVDIKERFDRNSEGLAEAVATLKTATSALMKAVVVLERSAQHSEKLCLYVISLKKPPPRENNYLWLWILAFLGLAGAAAFFLLERPFW